MCQHPCTLCVVTQVSQYWTRRKIWGSILLFQCHCYENFPCAFVKCIFTKSGFQVQIQNGMCKTRMGVSLTLRTYFPHQGTEEMARLANITQQSHPCGSHQPCPWWVPPGSMFALHTFFLGHTNLFPERCCCWPNTGILHLPEQPQQLLSAWECLSCSKSDNSLKTPLKIWVSPS